MYPIIHYAACATRVLPRRGFFVVHATLAPIPHVVAAGQIEMIPPADSLWIESVQDYTQVHSRQPDHKSLIRQTLTAWEECLPG